MRANLIWYKNKLKTNNNIEPFSMVDQVWKNFELKDYLDFLLHHPHHHETTVVVAVYGIDYIANR
jgi:hypothetical protein